MKIRPENYCDKLLRLQRCSSDIDCCKCLCVNKQEQVDHKITRYQALSALSGSLRNGDYWSIEMARLIICTVRDTQQLTQLRLGAIPQVHDESSLQLYAYHIPCSWHQ